MLATFAICLPTIKAPTEPFGNFMAMTVGLSLVLRQEDGRTRNGALRSQTGTLNGRKLTVVFPVEEVLRVSVERPLAARGGTGVPEPTVYSMVKAARTLGQVSGLRLSNLSFGSW